MGVSASSAEKGSVSVSSGPPPPPSSSLIHSSTASIFGSYVLMSPDIVLMHSFLVSPERQRRVAPGVAGRPVSVRGAISVRLYDSNSSLSATTVISALGATMSKKEGSHVREPCAAMSDGLTYQESSFPP